PGRLLGAQPRLRKSGRARFVGFDKWRPAVSLNYRGRTSSPLRPDTQSSFPIAFRECLASSVRYSYRVQKSPLAPSPPNLYIQSSHNACASLRREERAQSETARARSRPPPQHDVQPFGRTRCLSFDHRESNKTASPCST